MMSQWVERTWIRTGGYGRFRGEWVKCKMFENLHEQSKGGYGSRCVIGRLKMICSCGIDDNPPTNEELLIKRI